MKFRQMGIRISEQVSVLGFGCMRFPTTDEKINEKESEELLKTAIDNGLNYLDTAYPYHNKQSEPFIGNFLEKYQIRKKILLATKLPVWELNSAEDMDTIFNKQLENLKTDYIDFYLFHALDKKNWDKLNEYNGLAWAEQKKREGKIRYMGFSFHDSYEVFEEIIQGYDKWEFCQIQLNYMDIDHQQGIKGLELAHKHGIGVIIMEPLLGGKLCTAPVKIQKLWDSAEVKRTPTGWALQWLWDREEVSLILSGMSAIEHVYENIKNAEESEIGGLSNTDIKLVDQVREGYLSLKMIDCTDCKYCMPCPHGVDIPRNFDAYNIGAMYENLEQAKDSYKWITEDSRADICTACGECLEKCPQSISIIEELEKVAGTLQ